MVILKLLFVLLGFSHIKISEALNSTAKMIRKDFIGNGVNTMGVTPPTFRCDRISKKLLVQFQPNFSLRLFCYLYVTDLQSENRNEIMLRTRLISL